MKFSEIKNAVKHLLKTSKCIQCHSKYSIEDVSIIATTQMEGLFDLKCPICKTSTIVTVVMTPSPEIKIEPDGHRTHQSISKDDVLDIKNFLNKFDGNFKKLFINE